MVPTKNKRRIDLLLVERGICESRAKAQALVMAGAVIVGEARIDKSGTAVDPAAPIRIKEEAAAQRFVSRGALKLEKAFQIFPIDPAGRACADLGASTGGFTDLLLQKGATKVFAIDVGYGQLHPRLRADPRVVVHERQNARYLTEQLLGQRVNLVVADLSFISLRLVLPAIRGLLSPTGEAILLVKPQFEVGKGEVGKGGVVRDEAKRQAALDGVARAAESLGFRILGSANSPIKGPAGNLEWLLALRLDSQ